MQPSRVIQASLMTDNLSQTLDVLMRYLTRESEAGERYALELIVTGPLTVEEAVTHLWSRVRAIQVSNN